MVCLVYLALNEKDIAYARSKTRSNDYILTDAFCPPHDGANLDATFCDSKDKSLVPQI